jgi:N-succinyldiaminopimelate aminotransferase
LRSGYVAGDAAIVRRFLLYRTYHGNAMSPAIQVASAAAWNDEQHVRENRRLYALKFEQATPRIARRLETARPEAAFYLWAKTPIDEVEYARKLYAGCNITVLPGSFLARERDGFNPGRGFVRIALVADPAEVAEAAARIEQFAP